MWRHFGQFGLCLLIAPVATLAAQWRTGFEVGAVAFAGASADTSATSAAPPLQPYHATTFLMRLERGGRGRLIAYGIAVLYGNPGIAEESSDFITVAKTALHFYEISPAVSLRLAQPGEGIALKVHAGPLLDVWVPKGASKRARAGAHLGLSLTWPLGGRCEGSLRAALALTGSVFEDGDLPPRFELRQMWRRSLSGGASWRL